MFQYFNFQTLGAKIRIFHNKKHLSTLFIEKKMSEPTKHGNTTLDHVLKYTGVFGGVQGLNILMSIVRNKLASKLLGAAGIGLMGYYVAGAELAGNCSNMGIPISSVQHLSELFETDDRARITRFIRVIRTWCLWTALLAALLCGVGAVAYDWHFVLLAPMVMAVAVTGGEISILKGMRRLKRVATISVLAAVATFCLTIPFFWAFRLQGIILSLDCTALAITIIHLCFTLPLYPWRVSPLSAQTFREGLPLLRVGIPYVLTGIAGAAMAFALQAFLKSYSSDETLGYYRVGYTIMVSYAGIVFKALEPDYFPRLSSVSHDLQRCNQTINQQIRAFLLLMSPMLIALILLMPVILQVLYTSEFLPASSMTVCAVFYMFFRCLSVPIAYTALARGDSKTYMVMEIIYDIFSLSVIIGCYLQWQLIGIGIGLSLSGLFDLLLAGICYARLYHIRLERPSLLLAVEQAVLLAAAVAACLLLPTVWKYAFGALLLLLSVWRSARVLNRESDFVQKLRKRFRP